eukprot:2711706-Rhodomonas_salina.2
MFGPETAPLQADPKKKASTFLQLGEPQAEPKNDDDDAIGRHGSVVLVVVPGYGCKPEHAGAATRRPGGVWRAGRVTVVARNLKPEVARLSEGREKVGETRGRRNLNHDCESRGRILRPSWRPTTLGLPQCRGQCTEQRAHSPPGLTEL